MGLLIDLAVIFFFTGLWILLPFIALVFALGDVLAKKAGLPKKLTSWFADYLAAKTEIFYSSPLKMLALIIFTCVFALPWLWPQGGFDLTITSISIIFMAAQLAVFIAWKAANSWASRYEKTLVESNEWYAPKDIRSFDDMPNIHVPAALVALYYASLILMGLVVILSALIDLFLILMLIITAIHALVLEFSA
jgi:hypothetical protein